MLLSPEEINRRVTYHAPTPEAITRHGKVRAIIERTLAEIDDVVPDCREKSIVITELETAMFWANAGIARNHDKL